MNRPVIKVCGMQDYKNLCAVQELQPDYLGFILYKKSPRYLYKGNLTSKYLREINDVKKVGVFVNESVDEMRRQIDELALDALQLHGDESASFIEELRMKTVNVELWKTVSVGAAISDYTEYEGLADAILFDTASDFRGGSGKKFDWMRLGAYKGTLPFFLAGGLSCGDEAALYSFRADHPMCRGYDLNSGFEIAPGMKDVGLLKAFIQKVYS